ncbi:MAG: Hpt domain-containing protein, partial [Moraxella sp.]|nr:Hpt domain-containing protein [Moraxella sp.]
ESVSESVTPANSIANAKPHNASRSVIIEIPSVLQRFVEKASQPLICIFNDVDDDIKEIFIEEAQEVLDDAVPTFKMWRADREKRELLVEVRRHFHTLKGSGRMVGAMELGELAWAMENMLNRVLDNTIAMNEGMCTLVFEVLSEFGGLVDTFAKGLPYPDLMVLWTAVANAYAKGLGGEFDYRTLSQRAVYIEPDWTAQSIPDEPSTDDEEADDDVSGDGILSNSKNPAVNALASIQQAGELIQNITPVSPHDDEEVMLGQIFVEEGRELLADVQEFLDKHQDEQSVPVSDNVVRAFHTLRGASGLPSLKDVGDVGTMIERVLQDLQQHEQPMNQTHLHALGNAVALIQDRLTAYENADGGQDEHFQEDKHVLETLLPKEQERLPTISELIDGIDELLGADLMLPKIRTKTDEEIGEYATLILGQIGQLSERTKTRPKFQRLLTPMQGAYELIKIYPLCLKDDVFTQAVLSSHETLTGLFDAIAGSMSLKVDEAVLSALKDNTIRHTVDYHRQRHLQEISHAQNAIVAVFNQSQLNDDLYFEPIKTDDELLQIFLDEALDLDDVIQENLKAWHEDLHNPKYPQILQRHLHTIKGGAKLAGIISIDELAVEAEAVFEKLQSGQLTLSKGWCAIIGQLFDVLSLQFEMIHTTKQSFFAERTIAELHQRLLENEVEDTATIYTPKIELDDTPDNDEGDGDGVPTPTFDETMSLEKLIEESWQGVMPDKDILEVFLEEAVDLAESSAEEFGVFKNNTSDTQTLQSLQRKLHTIKGGARMVSANGMADLAHEMETVYEDLGNHRRPATKMITQLLYACHDWITSAVGLLKDHYNPPRPLAYIDALRQFLHNPDGLTVVPKVSLEQDILALRHYKAQVDETDDTRNISQMPPIKGVFGEQNESSTNSEMIRISAPLMERMINLSGEAAINRARIDMNMVSLTGSIEEMGATAQRLSDQLRRMDIELEAQILAQLDAHELDAGFDPLEMDQYSSLNQLSKSLSESASDLLDIKATLLEKTRDSENLLLQLSRTQTQLQDSLMSSRMVPFSRLAPRLQRIVRQTAGELGKTVELVVINADDEMDRNILDHITSPLEHMLRNAVDHGIEFPEYRSEIGKSATGHIILEVRREGDEIVILLSDDGAGIDVDAVRKKAISQGLIHATDQLGDNDIMQYIFNSGLSTTNKITQISGRGVGMDVVRSEIRQLGGSVSVESERGRGSRFIIRVPLTVAMSDALVVRVADRQYAVPLIQIDRVIQVDTQKLVAFYESSANLLKIESNTYRLRYLDEILNNNAFDPMGAESSVPVIIIKNRVGQLLALQVDEIIGSRTEVVVKPLGRQLSHLSGISAATIMGDGSVMLILDLPALMRVPQSRSVKPMKVKATHRDLIMVVDDSVTVRKVTSRFLERHGFDVLVAKDGVDAIEKLQDALPDLMLLDIEMPRMDGFEVATQVRNSPRLKGLPIIMITSRTGEKHRERALDIGVTDYMGKPYQEADLLERIHDILDNIPHS